LILDGFKLIQADMETLETLSLGLGLAALSGLSLYLTVFCTGMAIHFGWIHLAPQYHSLSVLGDPAILILSGVLFALEFFADKIPWVDSVWDAVHTLIRPVGGAFLATRALGHFNPVLEAIAVLLAGTMSFGWHSVKASTRLAVNTSPEPFSNIAVSTAENAAVVGATALLWKYPIPVFGCIAILFLLILYFLPRLWRSIAIKIWFISRKLNYMWNGEKVDSLPTRLPSQFEKAIRGVGENQIRWAVPCISGKGKYLGSNRFGYLAATTEEPSKVYFLTKKPFGGVSKVVEIEHFKVSVDRRLLYDELDLYSSGKNRRYTFRFDRGQEGIAAKVAEELGKQELLVTPKELQA
jgi:uncharacterized protein DUF4126